MTKEELLQDERIFSAANGDVSYIPLHSLEKFFSQNVVIPKGEKRHPYADVLHEWVEGSEIYGRRGQTWGSRNLCIHAFRDDEYRIKPSEPVYEWQWYKFLPYHHIVILHDSNNDELHQFFTEDEVDTNVWTRFEETKRERKQ